MPSPCMCAGFCRGSCHGNRPGPRRLRLAGPLRRQPPSLSRHPGARRRRSSRRSPWSSLHGYLVANRLVLSKRGTEVGAVPGSAAQSAPATGFNPPPHSIAVLPELFSELY